jgi:uncharacterized protein (TIGR04141 family)
MAKKQAPTLAKIKIPTRKLTVLLLRDTITSFDAALKSPQGLQSFDVSDQGGLVGKLYVPKTEPRTPKWFYFLKEVTGVSLRPPKNTTASALLILKRDNRHFAFTFGMARNLLKPEAFVLDFGLKVGLNRIDKSRLKSVDLRTYEDFVITTRKQVSRNSEIGTFGLDISRDLLRAVAGEPTDAKFATRLVGSDGLTFFAAVTSKGLLAKCSELLQAYNDVTYKADFEWIDHLSEVRDPALKQQLDDRLVDALRTKITAKMHLAPSEPIDWHEVEEFRIGGAGQTNFQNLDIDEYLGAIEDKLADLTIEKLKSQQVRVRFSNSDHFMNKWHLLSCIVWETEFKNELYSLVDGKWFRINKAFAGKIKDYIGGIGKPATSLPNALASESEDAYNKRVAGSVAGLALMDQKLVKPADYASKVEVCDLFSDKRQFIHVKRKTESATLSHLFAQGLISAQAFLNDELFRDEFRATLTKNGSNAHAALVPPQRPSSADYEIVYAIITKKVSPDWPASLPFFSQLNLMQHTKLLRGLGYKVTTQQVRAK